MLKFKQLKFPMILLVITMFFNSCTKEDNKAEVIVWQDYANANFLTSLGVNSLTCYVNGQIMASQAANVYYNGVPDCSSNGVMKFEINLENNTQGRINIVIKDQQGLERYNSLFDISSGGCNSLQLQ